MLGKSWIISGERKYAMTLNLGEMTTEEKLKAMEMLWDDICRSAPDFSSPYWHDALIYLTRSPGGVEVCRGDRPVWKCLLSAR